MKKAIRNVGAIIETPELYGYLSGMDNLKVAARPYRVRRSRINEVVEAVGLSEQIGEKVRRYSLGCGSGSASRRRCCTARKLLILDEPLNGAGPVRRASISVCWCARLPPAARRF